MEEIGEGEREEWAGLDCVDPYRPSLSHTRTEEWTNDGVREGQFRSVAIEVGDL